MATRLYFASLGAPSHSPAFDAAWDVTSGAIRRTLEASRDEPLFLQVGVASAANSPAGASDVLIAQFISAPLAANVSIAGAIRGQIRAFESNAAADERIQCVIRVIQSDYSTVRGTLIAANAGALSHEFSTALRNISIPLGGSTVPTTVNALTGDVIVVELGYRKHENATTSRTGTFDLGSVSGTDLPVDETTTAQNTAWIEFTEALTFATVETRVTQEVVQVAILPPTAETRVTQTVVQAAILPPTPDIRVTQVVAQVAILVSGAVLGSTEEFDTQVEM